MRNVLFILVFLFYSCANTPDNGAKISDENRGVWIELMQEVKVNELINELTEANKPGNYLFLNVQLIDLESENIRRTSVLVSYGQIQDIGNHEDFTTPANIETVNAEGMYMMPGLIDSHVHIGNSNSEKILNLLTGVTSVREMCGFEWMVEYAKRIDKNLLFAPDTYLAGTMLNFHDLGIYSHMVKTEDEARRAVRQQAEAGYDYIKVWNVMPEELLNVIAEEAQSLNMDLIGHVPHGLTIDKSLEVGYRTQEHFKGFILDRTLTLTKEDYDENEIAEHSDLWFCPTFSLNLQGLKGESATQFQSAYALDYIPKSKRERWVNESRNLSFGKRGNLPDSVFKMKHETFNKLYPTVKNFIAGTDNNGSNVNMIAGFALHEEIKIFESLGMPRAEALRTATTNASRALRVNDNIGSIATGKRANFILLKENPLDDLANLLGSRGIMIRGAWISPDQVKETMQKLLAIYRDTIDKLDNNSMDHVDYIVRHFLDEKNNYLVKPTNLIYLAFELQKIGLQTEALQVMKKASETYPWYYTYDQLGDLYRTQGKLDLAEKSYQRSIELYKYSPSANKL